MDEVVAGGPDFGSLSSQQRIGAVLGLGGVLMAAAGALLFTTYASARIGYDGVVGESVNDLDAQTESSSDAAHLLSQAYVIRWGVLETVLRAATGDSRHVPLGQVLHDLEASDRLASNVTTRLRDLLAVRNELVHTRQERTMSEAIARLDELTVLPNS